MATSHDIAALLAANKALTILAENQRQNALTEAIAIAEGAADETGDGEGEIYIARKIAEGIRKLKS